MQSSTVALQSCNSPTTVEQSCKCCTTVPQQLCNSPATVPQQSNSPARVVQQSHNSCATVLQQSPSSPPTVPQQPCNSPPSVALSRLPPSPHRLKRVPLLGFLPGAAFSLLCFCFQSLHKDPQLKITEVCLGTLFRSEEITQQPPPSGLLLRRGRAATFTHAGLFMGIRSFISALEMLRLQHFCVILEPEQQQMLLCSIKAQHLSTLGGNTGLNWIPFQRKSSTPVNSAQ